MATPTQEELDQAARSLGFPNYAGIPAGDFDNKANAQEAAQRAADNRPNKLSDSDLHAIWDDLLHPGATGAAGPAVPAGSPAESSVRDQIIADFQKAHAGDDPRLVELELRKFLAKGPSGTGPGAAKALPGPADFTRWLRAGKMDDSKDANGNTITGSRYTAQDYARDMLGAQAAMREQNARVKTGEDALKGAASGALAASDSGVQLGKASGPEKPVTVNTKQGQYTGTAQYSYDPATGFTKMPDVGFRNEIQGGSEDPRGAWWGTDLYDTAGKAGLPADQLIERWRSGGKGDLADKIRSILGRDPTYADLASPPGGEFDVGDPQFLANEAAIGATGKSRPGLGNEARINPRNPVNPSGAIRLNDAPIMAQKELQQYDILGDFENSPRGQKSLEQLTGFDPALGQGNDRSYAEATARLGEASRRQAYGSDAVNPRKRQAFLAALDAGWTGDFDEWMRENGQADGDINVTNADREYEQRQEQERQRQEQDNWRSAMLQPLLGGSGLQGNVPAYHWDTEGQNFNKNAWTTAVQGNGATFSTQDQVNFGPGPGRFNMWTGRWEENPYSDPQEINSRAHGQFPHYSGAHSNRSHGAFSGTWYGDGGIEISLPERIKQMAGGGVSAAAAELPVARAPHQVYSPTDPSFTNVPPAPYGVTGGPPNLPTTNYPAAGPTGIPALGILGYKQPPGYVSPNAWAQGARPGDPYWSNQMAHDWFFGPQQPYPGATGPDQTAGPTETNNSAFGNWGKLRVYADGGLGLSDAIAGMGAGYTTEGPTAHVDMQTGKVKAVSGEGDAPEYNITVPTDHAADSPIVQEVQRILAEAGMMPAGGGGGTAPAPPPDPNELTPPQRLRQGAAQSAVRPRVRMRLIA